VFLNAPNAFANFQEYRGHEPHSHSRPMRCAMSGASARLQDHYRHEAFDPGAFMAALSVRAAIGASASAIAS